MVGGWGLRILGISADDRLYEIAAAQRETVSRRQLLAAGLTPKEIQVRIERCQLRELHRGIYTTTHGPLPPLAAETAALLACGEHAVLSHTTALDLWRLLSNPVASDTLHVTVASGERGRKRDGITLHRTNDLAPHHIRRTQGLPATTPERTLADCSLMLEQRQLEKALDEALARHLTSLTKLRQLLAWHPHRHLALKDLVMGRERPTVTKEDAEERFLLLIRAAGLPEPHTQVMLYEQSVDAYWPEAHFAVEVDSIQWHTNRTKFENDRRKDQILKDHGITLTRATWHQITREPLQLTAHIARQIGLGSVRAA